MLKTVLSKIGEGLLIGIGAGVAVAGVMYVQSRIMMAEHEDQYVYQAGHQEYGPKAGLSIKAHRPQRAEANSAFVGQIVNEGTGTWRHVQIVVELFDKDGQFIDKCSDQLEGSISPGETRNFKVSCPNCPASPMPAYETYKVAIIDAYFSRPVAEASAVTTPSTSPA